MSPSIRFATLAAVGTAIVAILAIMLIGGSPAADPTASASDGNVKTATVERRDLVEQDTADGTLGYSRNATINNQLNGTLTKLPQAGATIRRGESLYEVDGAPNAYLFYGARPAWREFASGMTDGEDVRQLERNLVALGYDPNGVITTDDEFDSATSAAIERWQDARDVDETGVIPLGEIVFQRAAVRIAERKQSAGSALRPGQPILDITSNKLIVTVQLDASRQSLVKAGDSVDVELPDTTTRRRTITFVSRVAKPPASEDGAATVEVRIALRGKTGDRLDSAPVTVSIARARQKKSLAVPVAALTALEGGGNGVEVVGSNGQHEFVKVQTGIFADGYVAVKANGLREGTKVVIADEL
jgi:peptidoglycan hydrolase-like protein with peptidoglycan-binding domain